MGDELARQALLAAESMLIDHCTAEVVSALHAASVRPILLKGPAIARWLYAAEPGARDYLDIDLLVAPHQMADAKRVLGDLRYEGPPDLWLKGDVVAHGSPWTRASDGAIVDLHRTIHGCELLPDERVWRVLSAGTDTIEVGGVHVAVLGLPARLLHVVLHLEAWYGPGSKPWTDLSRALRTVDVNAWSQGLALARKLGVEAEVGIKLRRCEPGARLADALGVPNATSARLAYFQGTSDQQAVHRLIALVGWRSKLAFIVAKLLPPRHYLRLTGSRFVQMGRFGLVLAYLQRLGLAVVIFPKVLVGWVRGNSRRHR